MARREGQMWLRADYINDEDRIGIYSNIMLVKILILLLVILASQAKIFPSPLLEEYHKGQL